LQEKEDENWFKKTKVAKELNIFVGGICKLIENCKCAKTRSKLNSKIEGLNIGLQEKEFEKYNFLEDRFMRFYETIEGCAENSYLFEG